MDCPLDTSGKSQQLKSRRGPVMDNMSLSGTGGGALVCESRSTVGEILCMHVCVWTHTRVYEGIYRLCVCALALVCPCGIDRCSCLSTGGLLREFGDLWHALCWTSTNIDPVAADPLYVFSGDYTEGSVAVREGNGWLDHGCVILLQNISLFKKHKLEIKSRKRQKKVQILSKMVKNLFNGHLPSKECNKANRLCQSWKEKTLLKPPCYLRKAVCYNNNQQIGNTWHELPITFPQLS